MTYSIVARDPESGQLGVAAQSYYFALGASLPWARAGVGAVATQSWIDPGYGPRCLDLLAEGADAQVALDRVRDADKDSGERQVGVVGADGSVASFTGSSCVPEVGHVIGDGFTAQANLMARPGVCEAMAESFTATPGDLPTRMVAALHAAQRAGGDARGQMSATLIVVEGFPHDHSWEGVLMDVRVDHHPQPVEELARLIRVAQAHQEDEKAYGRLKTGDTLGALAAIERGLGLNPGATDLLLSKVIALIGLGRLEEARALTREVLAGQPGWAGVLRYWFEHDELAFIDHDVAETLLAP